MDAHGTVSTADGRVRDATLTGSAVATALEGPLAWRVLAEPIPVGDVDGTLDPAAIVTRDVDDALIGLRVFLYGTGGALDAVSFDLAFTTDEARSVTMLGATPRLR